MSDKVYKKGFVLYADTLETALTILKNYEQKGLLLEKILNYVLYEKVETTDDVVNTCFLFLKNSIDFNLKS